MAGVTIMFAEQGRVSGVGEATDENYGRLSVRQRDRDARAQGRVQRVVSSVTSQIAAASCRL
jgi:hypothetical protein